MARPLRIEYPGAFYHVTSRGNERRAIFETEADRERFLMYLESAHQRYGALIHVYSLLDNHYHLLVETPQGNLSRILHHVNGAYATYFNTSKGRFGHLFQGRYKAILVEKDAYSQELSRYIHLNPVRAGLVQHPSEYPWSSYEYYVGLRQAPAWLMTGFILEYFAQQEGVAQRRYRAFVEGAKDAARENPMEQVVVSTFLGSEEFIKSVKSQWIDFDNADMRNVPALKQIVARPSLEQIGEVVRAVFGEQGRVFRALCLYISQECGGFTLKEIGAFYGMNEAAVSQANCRFKRKLVTDENLRETVKTITKQLDLLNVET